MKILLGARSSALSRAQVEEIIEKFREHQFDTLWVKTPGDYDKTTSLRTLGQTDFFTRDLDELLLAGRIRIAIHSAKDLPNPLPNGLSIVAITRSIDSRDSLVFREGETLYTLQKGAVIATSSQRREEAVRKLRSDFSFIDLRGQIEERLKKLKCGEADGVGVAEAALIRLKLIHLNRVFLPGETTPMQGRLAVLARSNDFEMEALFA